MMDSTPQRQAQFAAGSPQAVTMLEGVVYVQRPLKPALGISKRELSICKSFNTILDIIKFLPGFGHSCPVSEDIERSLNLDDCVGQPIERDLVAAPA
jgi:hypothetical protein